MWTQGPWEIAEQWQGGITEGPYRVWSSRGNPDHANVKGKANAQLIALAPEMAEALLAAEQKLEKMGCYDDECGETTEDECAICRLYTLTLKIEQIKKGAECTRN